MIKVFIFFLLLITLSNPANSYIKVKVKTVDLKCFTDNLYHEARGEPILGLVLVGESVINRKNDKRWPSTICKVIYQPKQYSWTSLPLKKHKDEKLYKLLEDLAYIMLSKPTLENTTGINHYLRCDIRDKVDWWEEMEFLGAVGNHCFYKG